VRAIRLDEMTTPISALNMNNQIISNIASPLNDLDAANKTYVDNIINIASKFN
jgi:hypothetical protein